MMRQIVGTAAALILGCMLSFGAGFYLGNKRLLRALRRCENVELRQHCSLLEAEKLLRPYYPEWKGYWTPNDRADNAATLEERGGCPAPATAAAAADYGDAW